MKLAAAVLLLVATALAHAGTVTYVYTDPQGTPLAEADASGNITATFDYKPYGSQALGSSKAGPGYTGHVNDPDTVFVYMQARYYDPAVGRFLSLDPANVEIQNLFNFSRYMYANGNPLINIDPDGRFPMTEREATKLAMSLNQTSNGGSSGFWSVRQTGAGPNDFTVQSSEQNAMEKGGFTQQAEQGYQPGKACPATCSAIAVAAAAVAGDISDNPTADQGNSVRDANDTAEKALKLMEEAPSKSVSDLAKGLKVAPPVVKVVLLAPATVNNYKQCMSECTKDYQNRGTTEKKRGQ